MDREASTTKENPRAILKATSRRDAAWLILAKEIEGAPDDSIGLQGFPQFLGEVIRVYQSGLAPCKGFSILPSSSEMPPEVPP